MIASFGDKRTEALSSGSRVAKFAFIERTARRKLRQLEAAGVLEDLRVPPGNRLERLVGDWSGYHSIRINDQWRICFIWTEQGAHEVQIVDYHWRETGMAKQKLRSGKLAPVTPGEILWLDFMEPMGISRYRLAKDINVPAQRIGDIIMGKRAITADTALRLSRYFGLSDEYWMRVQWLHDAEQAKSVLEDELKRILPVAGSAK